MNYATSQPGPLRLRILQKVRRAPFTMVTPRDFVVAETAETCPASEIRTRRATPYCIDFGRRRVVFVVCPDPEALVTAPFFYLAQYEQARELITVPLEQLPMLYSPVIREPVFIHSIGRCGSTLLAKALHAGGIPTVSEVDIFYQLSELYRGNAGQRESALVPLLYWLIQALHVALPPSASTAAVKFRSQCTKIGDLLQRAYPESKSLFLVRDREEWARSAHKAFGFSSVQLATMLAECLAGLDRMRAGGAEILVLRYEELRSAPDKTTDRLGRFLGYPLRLDKATWAGLLSRDSQTGSAVARAALADRRTDQDEMLRAFLEHWERVRPGAIIEQFGMQDLL